MDDLIRAFQDRLALTAAEQPGFSGITLLTDPQTGMALAIGLWQTVADLLADERGGYEQEQIARLSNLLAAPPIRQVYEVSVQVELTKQGQAHIRGI